LIAKKWRTGWEYRTMRAAQAFNAQHLILKLARIEKRITAGTKDVTPNERQ